VASSHHHELNVRAEARGRSRCYPVMIAGQAALGTVRSAKSHANRLIRHGHIKSIVLDISGSSDYVGGHHGRCRRDHDGTGKGTCGNPKTAAHLAGPLRLGRAANRSPPKYLSACLIFSGSTE